MTRRPLTSVALALAVVSAAPTALHAQYRANLRAGISAPAAPAAAVSNALPRAVKPTYWKRGAVIGGAITAAAWIAYIATHGCGSTTTSERCLFIGIMVTPVAALIGAIPGALIGGLFPKE